MGLLAFSNGTSIWGISSMKSKPQVANSSGQATSGLQRALVFLQGAKGIKPSLRSALPYRRKQYPGTLKSTCMCTIERWYQQVIDSLIHRVSKINELLKRQLFAATLMEFPILDFIHWFSEVYKVLSLFLSIFPFFFFFFF